MTWSKKHDEFVMLCKLRPSTRLLLRWLLRRAKPNEISEIEIDLKQFNKWVASIRSSGFDRKTIREAIAQLNELTNGLVVIYKTYSPWVHKLLVRPLSFALEKKPPKLGNSPKLATIKPMFDDASKKRAIEQQQQNISKLDVLLKKVGLHYDPDALNRIWRLAGKSIDNVVDAIELLLYRHSTKKDGIGNARGYLIDILTKGYAKGFNLYYDGVDLPFFQRGVDIVNFVKGIIPQSNIEQDVGVCDRNQLRYQT